jgi:hypothetical protein
MKRYLLFAGYQYYPDGGWEDFKGGFDTLQECSDAYVLWYSTGGGSPHGRWAQIVDLQKLGGPGIVLTQNGSATISWERVGVSK